MNALPDPPGALTPFTSPAEHLRARLDVLETTLRAHLEPADDDHGDRDTLDAPPDATRPSTDVLAAREARSDPAVLRLRRLAAILDLSDLDQALLLLAVAPEVDPRFEAFYAHLHGNPDLRLPTLGLAHLLLAPGLPGLAAVRSRLAQDAPLRRWQLVHLQHSTAPGSHLHAWLRADEAAVDYLLGQDDLDPALIGWTLRTKPVPGDTSTGPVPPASHTALADRLARARAPGTLIQLCGPADAGGRDVAAALARRRGLELLELRGDLLAERPPDEQEKLLSRALRQARLHPAALLWPFTRWPDHAAALHEIWPTLRTHPHPLILRLRAPWSPLGLPPLPTVLAVDLPPLDPAAQSAVWQDALGLPVPVATLAAATNLRLRPGQIRTAAASARGRALLRGETTTPDAEDIAAAAREASRPNLGQLATLRSTHLQWDHLVLPDPLVAQLHALATRVRLQHRVLRDWGFQRRLASGRGSVALFTGPPGTGKTLAATILAREAGIELFCLDLSAVVSKYIGETEKNLERVFSEAGHGHVALFFDEADALFGKRSEVKDSRDRYANMEVGYLLQRIEAHDGLVILASNHRQHLDPAFVRRFHAILDFPLPDELARRRLWAAIWPPEAPLGPDVDPRELARRFELSGGDIHNSALDAAFSAAACDAPVSRADIFAAVRRTLVRGGHLIDERKFA